MSAPTAALAERKELPEAVTRRGIDEAQWRTLCSSLYPGAHPQSILMVLDYCKARGLDPLKKPCHIVPIRVKVEGEWVTRDVVMPGIYEYRTTAMRTGRYLGHSRPEYGPMVELFGVTAPEWCEMTMYRLAANGERIEFPVRVYFREAVATRFDKDSKKDVANDRWSRAPIQMLTKCTEAAGLREAFPDELGGETTAEEMSGQAEAKPEPTVIQQPQRLSTTAAPVAPEPVAEPSTPAGVTITQAIRRESKTQAGRHFWVVQDSAGRIYFAMSDELGEACARFQEAGTPVTITSEPVDGQPYPNITEIEAAR